MIKLEINEQYGSHFQTDFARESLFSMLDSWVRFINMNHKKNKVSYIIKRD